MRRSSACGFSISRVDTVVRTVLSGRAEEEDECDMRGIFIR